MAPSQQEYHHHQEDLNAVEYTHKKFNCSYSHKKLGMRLMRRNSQEELLQQEQGITTDSQNNQRTTTSSNSLFRPYALDNDAESSKKRKISSTEKSSETSQVPVPSQTPQNYMTPATSSQIPYHLYQTAQQSEEEYALKLQRQRAALYMKHVMQFYENGNGWPSVHPNAINNPALYRNN